MFGLKIPVLEPVDSMVTWCFLFEPKPNQSKTENVFGPLLSTVCILVLKAGIQIFGCWKPFASWEHQKPSKSLRLIKNANGLQSILWRSIMTFIFQFIMIFQFWSQLIYFLCLYRFVAVRGFYLIYFQTFKHCLNEICIKNPSLIHCWYQPHQIS